MIGQGAWIACASVGGSRGEAAPSVVLTSLTSLWNQRTRGHIAVRRFNYVHFDLNSQFFID
jgi:hypothetical protein